MPILFTIASNVYTDTLISTIVDTVAKFYDFVVYTDTLISTIVDEIDADVPNDVYTDTLISTIVDSLPSISSRANVYTDTLISTIVDKHWKRHAAVGLYRHFNFYYCRCSCPIPYRPASIQTL